ncbi:ATP-binding protein [Paracoccus sp. WLY502]|uniref:sensor histidine kinase n=1 Tax=Paracoccus yibinensis TaxID=3068891 RepID=UPI002796DD9F|nr:ATP-binding protein [Paracoccus sp. WLY502]MDQ1901637.1 ATP-binding protein [Paracoccus sp. WLY502]
MGQWTLFRVEAAVKEDIGNRNSVYFRYFFADYLSELERSDSFSAATTQAIGQEIDALAEDLNLIAAKIWTTDGRILFDTDPSLISRQFPVTEGLAKAVGGTVAVEFENGSGDHGNYPGQKTLEVYVPLRRHADGPVLAVAELYYDRTSLLATFQGTRRLTWMIDAVVLAVVALGIYPIVAQGDNVIDRQRAELKEKVERLTQLLEHNKALRLRIQKASSLSAENAELHLRRIGADLHDGIGQLLTISLLKLDQLFPGDQARSRDYVILREMLEEAMGEVRAMVSGLSLPHMMEKGLTDAIGLVILKHRHRTSTTVDCMIEPDLNEVSNPVKLAICRMVQEGLNNAYKHAGGKGQSVTVRGEGGFVVVTISDEGPGMQPHAVSNDMQQLGLTGLRNRIISLGGSLSVDSVPGKGVTLTGYFPTDV